MQEQIVNVAGARIKLQLPLSFFHSDITCVDNTRAGKSESESFERVEADTVNFG